jgi:GNAT superfamily N-acetyltransferase
LISLFSIDITYEDISITSINADDMNLVKSWLIEEQVKNNNEIDTLNIDDFYNRYVEYFVSENEIFIKIIKGNLLIGVLKGRMEFKEENEVWISFFLIDSKYRRIGIGSNILHKLKEYFDRKFGINTFYSKITSGDKMVEKFWQGCGYSFLRSAKNFYKINGKTYDMLILKSLVT